MKISNHNLFRVLACMGLTCMPAAAQNFTNLYNFTGSYNSEPLSSMVVAGDMLYGTTYGGGSGYGTVFAVNLDGTGFTNLYSFTPVGVSATNSDGTLPEGGLILSGMTLYGTCYQGGTNGSGTIFAVNTDGTGFTNLYNFSGQTPNIRGNLVLASNLLYGTASGGDSGTGIIYAINTNGTGFKPLYNFTKLIPVGTFPFYTNYVNNDGSGPVSGVILSGNKLYGTAQSGGANGVGTVYKVNTDGTGFTTLHNFTGASDGASPLAQLVLSSNTLYGTTYSGGISNSGTVFSVTTDGGDFTTLHGFTGGSDGGDPQAGLILSGNTLYGTTYMGGNSGNGTVFSIHTDGTDFTNLYSFMALVARTNSDGRYPLAGVTLSGNALYGVTISGGSAGVGTIFKFVLFSGFFIVPTFDSSITDDPNGPAMMAAINAANEVFHTNISDNFTVYIEYVSSTNLPPGQVAHSDTWIASYSYSNYLTALTGSATSANDFKAVSPLQGNYAVNPLDYDNRIILTKPLARHLGLSSGVGSNGFDAIITINLTQMNLTRPPTIASNYDLQTAVEHEDDEVLGSGSGQIIYNHIWPMDLFRYNSALERVYTSGDDDAYFSVDGTNLLARFNTDPRGDYGDWWSANGTSRWAPLGITPTAQVQDAFGMPGAVLDFGPNELTMLDVIGWTLTATPLSAPALKLIGNSTGQFTLSWSDDGGGYTLQESTDMSSGSWVASTIGSSNNVVIPTTASQKFYRLYKVAAPASKLVKSVAVKPSEPASEELTTRIFQGSQP